MLSLFAENIWGQKKHEEELRSPSTEASSYVPSPLNQDVFEDCPSVCTNQTNVFLWRFDNISGLELVCEGDDVECFSTNFVISVGNRRNRLKRVDTLDDCQNIVRSKSFEGSLTPSKKAGDINFNYSAMSRFRLTDVFEWTITSESMSVGEFKMRITKPNLARYFCDSVFTGLIRCCDTTLFCIPCSYSELSKVTNDWEIVYNECMLCVHKREISNEIYLCVSGLKNETSTDINNMEDVNYNIRADLVTQDHIKDFSKIILAFSLADESFVYPDRNRSAIKIWNRTTTENPEERRLCLLDFSVLTDNKISSPRNININTSINYCNTSINYCNTSLSEFFDFMEKRLEKLDSLNTLNADDYCDCDLDCYNFENSPLLKSFEEVEDDLSCNEYDTNDMSSTDEHVISSTVTTEPFQKSIRVGRNRTFVLRKSLYKKHSDNDVLLDVMKFNENLTADVIATFDGSRLTHDTDGKICPRDYLLNDCESKLLILDDSKKNLIYNFDVETQTIINRMENYSDVHGILERYKGSSYTSEPNFLAFNSSQINFLDTRLPKQTNSGPFISYVSPVQFVAGGVDSQGHILMGSQNGDLRFYNGEVNADGKLKKAKNHFIGKGDALLHVAVNKEGTLVVGTTQDYLVLYPIKKSCANKTAFTHTILKNEKPASMILRVSIDDLMKHGFSDVRFRRAEFNDQQNTIVSSTGKFIVMWNLMKIIENSKNGIDVNKNAYTIHYAADYVQDVDFVRTPDISHTSVIVATPFSVCKKNIKS